jgi:transposase
MVMDNATFHKGDRIEQLIQEVGYELLYLPAYSPGGILECVSHRI